MRHDPDLWKEYRNHRTNWMRRQLERNATQFFPFFYLMLILIFALNKPGATHLLVLGGAIYATATTVFRGLALRLGVLQGFDRTVLVYFPISDENFLKYEMGESVWSWGRAAVGFLLIYGDALVIRGQFTNYAAFALIAGLLQAACGLCLAMLLVSLAPRLLTWPVATSLYLVILVCFWAPHIGELLWPGVLVVPGGWISHGFAAATRMGDGNALWFVPAFLLASCLPLAYSACRKQLFKELSAQTLDVAATSSILEEQDEERHEQSEGASPQLTDPNVWKGHLQESEDWGCAGWMERLVARCFDRWQKVVAEFMLGGQLGTWSKQWRISALVTLAGLALIAAVQVGPAWVYIIPAVAAAFLGAPLFGGYWWGFYRARTSGYLMPTYAAFPASYTEISIVMWKSNIVRALAWAPLALLHITALSMKFGRSLDFGIVVSAEIVLLLLALQPVMIAGRFSAGTNDTNPLNWRAAALLITGLVPFTVFVASAVLLFATTSILWKLTGTMGMSVSSTAAWWAYRLLFDRGRIDVLSKPA